MRGKYRFTTITATDGETFVIHSGSISYLETCKVGLGEDAVKVVMNSGHALYASGSLKEVMTELYGRSFIGSMAELYRSSVCFLRRLFQKRA